MAEFTLDARRLLCPMPVIKTQNHVKTLQPGDILTITCTDPGVTADIPAWCRINGHAIISIEENKSEILIRLKVGPAQTAIQHRSPQNEVQ